MKLTEKESRVTIFFGCLPFGVLFCFLPLVNKGPTRETWVSLTLSFWCSYNNPSKRKLYYSNIIITLFLYFTYFPMLSFQLDLKSFGFRLQVLQGSSLLNTTLKDCIYSPEAIMR